MSPFTDPFVLIEVIGIIAFAISGGAVAIPAGMDWVGITVLAVITAVGGGMLRDLLMGQAPVGWLLDSLPLWVSLVTAASAHLVSRSSEVSSSAEISAGDGGFLSTNDPRKALRCARTSLS